MIGIFHFALDSMYDGTPGIIKVIASHVFLGCMDPAYTVTRNGLVEVRALYLDGLN